MYIIELPGYGFFKASYDSFMGNVGSRQQAKVWKTREAAERNATRLRGYYSSIYRQATVVEVAA